MFMRVERDSFLEGFLTSIKTASLPPTVFLDQGIGGSNPLSTTNYPNPVIELASFRLLIRKHSLIQADLGAEIANRIVVIP
jgi:hypothetical protein